MSEKSIDQLCEELLAKREEALVGGGTEAAAKQHEKGKMTARERILAFLDEGSFVEIDEFVKHRCSNFNMGEKDFPGDGVVAGYGTVDGRAVYIYSQDFTVLGGSLGEVHAQKICKVMDLSVKNGAPLIGINDSGGARIQEGVNSLSGYGNIFFRNVKASGVVPQITIIAGPCAGGAVYSPALTDFVFMIDKMGLMHITGPAVIKAVTGEEVSSEELGGAKAHNEKSGVAHFFAKDETDCFDQVRKLLSYLPGNNMEDLPVQEAEEDPYSQNVELRKIVPTNPNKGYDVREVIRLVMDTDSFFEVQAGWAKNMVVGFARIGGIPVGIIANQANVKAGCLDIDASDKASRFIRFCDAYTIPIVTLEDVPGYLPGVEQEHGGIIRHGAKLIYAYSEATTPMVTVILRKAYGGSYIGMCCRELGADWVLAWPQAQVAVMGAQGAANIVFRKDIEAAKDPVAMRSQKIEEYEEAFANPYKAAERGYVDRVILPEETRSAIYEALVLAESKKDQRPRRKHGVMPN